jgi:hypothetical protein
MTRSATTLFRCLVHAFILVFSSCQRPTENTEYETQSRAMPVVLATSDGPYNRERGWRLTVWPDGLAEIHWAQQRRRYTVDTAIIQRIQSYADSSTLGWNAAVYGHPEVDSEQARLVLRDDRGYLSYVQFGALTSLPAQLPSSAFERAEMSAAVEVWCLVEDLLPSNSELVRICDKLNRFRDT